MHTAVWAQSLNPWLFAVFFFLRRSSSILVTHRRKKHKVKHVQPFKILRMNEQVKRNPKWQIYEVDETIKIRHSQQQLGGGKWKIQAGFKTLACELAFPPLYFMINSTQLVTASHCPVDLPFYIYCNCQRIPVWFRLVFKGLFFNNIIFQGLFNKPLLGSCLPIPKNKLTFIVTCREDYCKTIPF